LGRLTSTLAAAFVVIALTAATAAANNRQVLDAQAASPGNVVQDATGTGYIAWAHTGAGGAPDVPRFCKVPRGGTCTAPITLPIPGATSSVDGVSGAFPVFGAGGVLNVVAPRYVQNDVVIYTSVNGGASFDGGTVIPGGGPPGTGPYSNKTNPTEVLRSGSNILIAAYNAGLGFSSFGALQGAISFTNPGPGGVVNSTMGLDAGGNPVIAYYNLASTYPVLFYRFNGTGTLTDEAAWVGPTAVSLGYLPRLAGGASGLFLTSQDYATPTSSAPTVLHVRKYTGAGFGAPVTVVADPDTNLFVGGAMAQSAAGRLAVVWPGKRAGDSLYVQRLFVSTNGGASFAGPINVAATPGGLAVQDNAKLSVGDDLQGWLTFRDNNGLELADLSAITPYKPPAYKGKNSTKSTGVEKGVSITLKLPKSCVQTLQSFKVYIGTRIKHKIAGGRRGKVTRAVVSLDKVKLKTIKKRPFRYLVPGINAATKTKHVVSVKVTVRIKRPGHGTRTKTKTVKGTVKIC
jgi:hypothetical protein